MKRASNGSAAGPLRNGVEMERRQYQVGDLVCMKKKHPCGKPGCDRWKVLRVGADFRLACSGCGRQLMMPRPVVEKNTREIIKNA